MHDYSVDRYRFGQASYSLLVNNLGVCQKRKKKVPKQVSTSWDAEASVISVSGSEKNKPSPPEGCPVQDWLFLARARLTGKGSPPPPNCTGGPSGQTEPVRLPLADHSFILTAGIQSLLVWEWINKPLCTGKNQVLAPGSSCSRKFKALQEEAGASQVREES